MMHESLLSHTHACPHAYMPAHPNTHTHTHIPITTPITTTLSLWLFCKISETKKGPRAIQSGSGLNGDFELRSSQLRSSTGVFLV